MTLILKLDGVQIAVLTGEIEHGRRTDPKAGLMANQMIDDPLIYVLRRDGKTVFVLNVSADRSISVEEIP